MSDRFVLHAPKNEVEKKGISLALGKSKKADLNIIVIDNSSKKYISRYGKTKTKSAAFTQFAFYFNSTTLQLYQTMSDRQSDPRSP